MLKKIIFLSVLCIIISLLSLLFYNVIKYIKNYKPKQTLYDEYLTLYKYDIMEKILDKLNYSKKYKEYKYKEDGYDIIIYMNNISEKSIEKWRKWVNKGKRVIVFYNRVFNAQKKIFESEYNYDKKYSTLKVNSKNGFTNINNLFMSEVIALNTSDKIFNKYLEPLILYKNNLIAAKEAVNGGEIIYISDKSLFSDYAILKADNALLLNDLLKDYYTQTIVLDNVYDNEQDMPKDEHNPYFLFMGNFVFIFLQIIIIAVMFFLANIKRFGPWLDKDKFDRRSLTRHIEVVGYFYEKSNDPFVYINILDRYFLMRLKKITKINYNKKSDIVDDIKKRYNIQKDEEFIFEINDTKNIVKKETAREKLIRKLRGA